MSHAVIKTGGKQFLVEEGQTIRVPSLAADAGSSVELEALLTTAAEAAKITSGMLAIAEIVRPKLIEDGMFLVGLDIVGDKILEINVFTPGGLPDIAGMHKIDFCEEIIEALENKIAIRKVYAGSVSNRALATL